MKHPAKLIALMLCCASMPASAQNQNPTGTELEASQHSSTNILFECDLIALRGTDEAKSFLVELNKPSTYGLMHCVYDLTVDMTPCSLDGNWSLSYPTGDASIASINPTMSEAYEHFGGKFYSGLAPLEFRATALFGEGLDPVLSEEGYDFDLTIDRRTGMGSLIQRGALGAEVECHSVDRTF